MTGTVAMRRAHLVARFDASRAAVLDELVPLEYSRVDRGVLPAHVRAASALRRFANRLVIVQDDVNALAVRDAGGVVRPVLLPPHASGSRVFDDTLGNKHDKLDLEACVALPDGRLVAFGSGSTPERERLVVWDGQAAPAIVDGSPLYRELRASVTDDVARLNIEGAVVRDTWLELFHRGNDAHGAGRAHANAIVDMSCDDFAAWLDGRASTPAFARVTTVDLGDVGGVPFGFTDAVALDADRVVVLACAEDSACAITDGAVLGCRVGLLDEQGLSMVDIREENGACTQLKLEGIERRPGSASEFDVVADVDRPATAAQLGRLVWERR